MTYTPKRTPWAKQQEALDRMADRPPHWRHFFALLMAMRCVDSDTEYLSPRGWRKMKDYDGGLVAEFRLDGTAHFVEPLEYTKSPVDQFWHFKTSGGVDQVLSSHHRILLCSRERARFGKPVGPVPRGARSAPRDRTNTWRETSPAELIHLGRKFKDHVPTTFFLHRETKLDMSDDEIRLMVAFHADATKSYGPEWWDASDHQRRIIADEAVLWDGGTKKSRGSQWYASKHESDVDFIQYCFASTGRRTSKILGGKCSTLSIGHRTSNLALLPQPVPYDDHDGFMYSFSVPSTYLVFRRNGKVFVSGNTGKTKVTLDDFGRLQAQGEADDLLVVAPAGVYRTWVTAIQDHVGEDLEKALGVYVFSAQDGSSKSARERLQSFLDHAGPRVLLMNVEALSTVRRAQDLCIEFARGRRVYGAIDECFPVGTLIDTPVGSIPIESVRPRSTVSSSAEPQVVRRLIKKNSSLLAVVTLQDGRVIRSTPNHPFFTNSGWKCAGNLKSGDFLYDRSAVQGVLEGVSVLKTSSQGEAQTVLRDILLSEVADASARSSSCRVYSGTVQEDEPGSQRQAAGHPVVEQGHPDGGNDATEAVAGSKEDGASSSDHRGEWKTPPRTTEAPTEVIRLALDTGARHPIGREAARLSNLLQGRSGEHRSEACDRMRRSEPPQQTSCNERQEEGCEAQGARVASVEIEELPHPVPVFDLELSGTPHFFAGGVLVHNSTTIKSYKSKRAKFCVNQLGPRLAHRRILSGLLAPQSPLDAFMQFEFLEPGCLGFSSYWTFRSRYAIMQPKLIGGRRIEILVGFHDTEDLARRMRPHSFRVRLEDCYDLPPKIYVPREVPMTEEQVRAYREMREYATFKLSTEAHVTATMAMVQMMRLHQILCGHVRDESGHLHHIPENRTRELLALLEEHEGKAIVWCAYDEDVQRVARALQEVHGPGSVARFWGGNMPTREEEERRFKEDPSCLFMVATPAAGGRGRTWDVADINVYYSNGTNLEHREQSEERPQLVGKQKSVLYVDLVAVGPRGEPTVDHKHLKALREKINLASVLNGDAWREWVI